MTRYVKQPGPPRTDRIVALPAFVEIFDIDLPQGPSLLDEVVERLLYVDCDSAILELQGGGFGPFTYVMPSLPVDDQHAAFYSKPYSPLGTTLLQAASMTFGQRDGSDFFHCHGLWIEDGVTRGGHIMPESTAIAEPITARVYLLYNAKFEGTQDSETNFKLFEPVPCEPRHPLEPDNAFAIRLLPNQDLCEALEGFCRKNNIASASIHGGVGSIIEARFTDGTVAPRFATEMFITRGTIEPNVSGELEASIDVSLVDYAGEVFSGRLVRGDNPVLMTVELVLVTSKKYLDKFPSN